MAVQDDVGQQGCDNGSGHDHIPLFSRAARKVSQGERDRLLLRILQDGHFGIMIVKYQGRKWISRTK